MIVFTVITLLAVVLGLLVPLRWGVAGYVVACVVLMAALVLVAAGVGLEGYSLADSVALFEGSVVAYSAFAVESGYRNAGLPLFALAVTLMQRMARARV